MCSITINVEHSYTVIPKVKKTKGDKKKNEKLLLYAMIEAMVERGGEGAPFCQRLGLSHSH